MSDPRARRELASVVVASVAGAALALLAASRTWTVSTHRRPAPLPVETITRSGGALLPWLTAVALVGLAGAGALLATRGSARRFVGTLTALAGIGVTIGGAIGVTRTAGARIAWPVLVILGGLVLTACGVYATRRSAAWPSMGARYDRATPPVASPTATTPAAAPPATTPPGATPPATTPPGATPPAGTRPNARRPTATRPTTPDRAAADSAGSGDGDAGPTGALRSAAAPARPPKPQGTGNIAMWDALDRGVDPTEE